MKSWNLSIFVLYFVLVKEHLCLPVKNVKGDRRLLAAILGYRKEDTGFINDVLRVHNKYRSIHGCPQLGQCARLRQQAGLYAQKLADQGARVAQGDPGLEPGIGENIFISCGNEVSGEAVVNHWYEEVCNYFDNKKSYNEYKHFAQVVWKATYLIGIGRRTSEKSGEKCTYVVTRYRPGAEQGPAESVNIPKGSFDSNGICSGHTASGGKTGSSTGTAGSNTAQSTGNALPDKGSVGSENSRGGRMAGSNGITGSNSIPGITSTGVSGVLGTGDRERAKNPENSHISPLIEQHETGSEGSPEDTPDQQQMSPASHCPPCPGNEIQTESFETSGGAENLPKSKSSPLRSNRETEQPSKPDQPARSTNAGNPTEQGKPAQQNNLPDRSKPVEQANPVVPENPANPGNSEVPGDTSPSRGKQCPACLCPNREGSSKVDEPQGTQENQPQTGEENKGSPSRGKQVEPSGTQGLSGKVGTQVTPKNVGQQGSVPSGKEGGEGTGGNEGSQGSLAGGSEGPRESSTGGGEGSQGSSQSQGTLEGGSSVASPGSSAGGNEGPQGSSAGGNEGSQGSSQSQGSLEGGSSVAPPGSSAGGNEGPQRSSASGNEGPQGSSASGPEGSQGSPAGGNEGSRGGTGTDKQPQSGGVESAGKSGGDKMGGDQEGQTGTPGSEGSRSIPEGGAFIEDPNVFQQSALEAHNKYRQFHSSPGLSLDGEMSASATEFAQKLAESGINNAEHSLKSSRVDEAESIYSACGTNPSGADVSKEWYKELCNYNYNKHAAIDATKSTGHFTQVIWKSSRKFGIGRAYGKKEDNKDCIYVVARYKPPGNVVGSESTNIARGTMDAEYCGREYMALNSQESEELSPEDQAKGNQPATEESNQQTSGSREENNPESGNQEAITGPSSESNSAEAGTANEINQPKANGETNQATTTSSGTGGGDGSNKSIKTPFLPGYLQKSILEGSNKRYRGFRTE
ncbi:hornerin-like isoform X2 [Dendronephthya gigantea]|uniref:hornerin-like isoform X2 n=1 Tax=Dendronephthya gigantea TaxID=151771 RepID=UPI00106B2704|nr:hornerin-like isoform X2 [Dendronephthya gigantea]